MAAIIDWLNSSLGGIKHELFDDVVKVENIDKKPMGDGQLVTISDLGRVTVTLVTSKGEKKKVTAILKTEACEGPGKDFANLCDAFNTEIMMYNNVLKSMEKLMGEVDDVNYLWPDCYHCGDNKLLIQDLCETGYRIVPVSQYFDVEHAVMVMKAIGKFHALTAVMKERNSFDSSDFKAPFYARKIPFMDAMNIQNVKNLTKTMKEHWGSEWVPIADRLAKYLENPGELVFNSWEASRGKWDVLNHGDFNRRNMLFHYPPDSGHPDSIKFIDFQLCHYSNSCNDLITLLYSSLRPSERDENMDLLLQTYVDNFIATAKMHGYKERLPTVKDVQESLKLLAPVIVSFVIMSIPFFVMAGRDDAQEKADEYMARMKDNKEDISVIPEEMRIFEDKIVKSLLQYELKKCIENNVF